MSSPAPAVTRAGTERSRQRGRPGRRDRSRGARCRPRRSAHCLARLWRIERHAPRLPVRCAPRSVTRRSPARNSIDTSLRSPAAAPNVELAAARADDRCARSGREASPRSPRTASTAAAHRCAVTAPSATTWRVRGARSGAEPPREPPNTRTRPRCTPTRVPSQRSIDAPRRSPAAHLGTAAIHQQRPRGGDREPAQLGARAAQHTATAGLPPRRATVSTAPRRPRSRLNPPPRTRAARPRRRPGGRTATPQVSGCMRVPHGTTVATSSRRPVQRPGSEAEPAHPRRPRCARVGGRSRRPRSSASSQTSARMATISSSASTTDRSRPVPQRISSGSPSRATTTSGPGRRAAGRPLPRRRSDRRPAPPSSRLSPPLPSSVSAPAPPRAPSTSAEISSRSVHPAPLRRDPRRRPAARRTPGRARPSSPRRPRPPPPSRRSTPGAAGEHVAAVGAARTEDARDRQAPGQRRSARAARKPWRQSAPAPPSSRSRAGAAPERVVAVAPAQQVLAVVADEGVAPGAAVDVVVATTARQLVVAAGAEQTRRRPHPRLRRASGPGRRRRPAVGREVPEQEEPSGRANSTSSPAPPLTASTSASTRSRSPGDPSSASPSGVTTDRECAVEVRDLVDARAAAEDVGAVGRRRLQRPIARAAPLGRQGVDEVEARLARDPR